MSRIAMNGRKDKGGHYAIGLWFPNGYSIQMEGRKDMPAKEPRDWCENVLKQLAFMRDMVEKYRTRLDVGDTEQAGGNDPVELAKEQR